MLEQEFFSLKAIVDKDKNIYFKGKDVATALGYQDTKQAVRKHVEDDDKISMENLRGVETTTLNWNDKNTIYINEAGFYSLVLSSKLESAKAFKNGLLVKFIHRLEKQAVIIIKSFQNHLLSKLKMNLTYIQK